MKQAFGEFYRYHIAEDLYDHEKSEAHLASDQRAKAFHETIANFFGNSAIGKALSGFIIKPEEEKTTPSEFIQKVNAEPSYRKKAMMLLSAVPKLTYEAITHPLTSAKQFTKLVGKMTLDALQFTFRNSIKQPAMVIFRLGALINNASRYAGAKLLGNQEEAAKQAANVKYQTGKLTKAAISTACIAAVDIAIVGSGGIALPLTGVASAAITNVAVATHFSSLAQGASEVTAATMGLEGGTKLRVRAQALTTSPQTQSTHSPPSPTIESHKISSAAMRSTLTQKSQNTPTTTTTPNAAARQQSNDRGRGG